MHSNRGLMRPFATGWLLLVAVAPATAQTITEGAGSSALRQFSESRTTANGGTTGSASYALSATFGRFGGAARSATYALSGGFPSTLTGRSIAPWLTAARPTIVTPRSQDLVWLSGTRLSPDTPTVTVSGRPATLVAHSGTDVAIRLPGLSAPGWHRIDLRNSAGQTTLERGIGVLPILHTDRAPGPNLDIELVFRGSKGDSILWAVGLAPGPRLAFGAYLHGLTLGLAGTKVMPTLSITADDGSFRLAVPAAPYPPPLYAQALFLTSNPGYAPGSFSNLLRL